MGNLDLAVCILFWEKLEQTIECIQSFLQSGVNIYVLNNGSSLSSRQALGRFCDGYKQVKIHDSDVNLGVGPGRNYLVTHTTEEWLLFVDNDITVGTADWLQRFDRWVSRYPETEVFIPQLFEVNSREYSRFPSFRIFGQKVIFQSEYNNKLNLTNRFPGGAALVNRKLFSRLGLYDDKMFVGVEDYEFSIRAMCLGEPIRAQHIDDIELVHRHRSAKTDEDKKTFNVRYDLDIIQASYDRITEKHHLVLDGNWRRWFADMKTNKNIMSFVRKVLRRMIAGAFALAYYLPPPIKNVLRRILRRMTSGPFSCSLHVTDRCNFKCDGCYRSVLGVKRFSDMTLTTIQKVVSSYGTIGAFTVAGLGEPTLCPDFASIIDFLKANHKFVGVITNGTNPEPLLSLTCEPNYISVSLKGYDTNSYLANTGADSFETVIDTISKLKSRFRNVGFSYILKRSNYRDLDRLLPLCDSLKPDFLHLTNYLVYDPGIADEVEKIITVNDLEIINYINQACVGREYIRVKPVYVDFDNPKFTCRSYENLMNLDGVGNIGGCQRQIPPDGSFGNIFTGVNQYNSSEMRKCRDLQRKGCYAHDECRYCFGNWGP